MVNGMAINLLPWREQYRLKQRKFFLTSLIAINLLGLFILMSWRYQLTTQQVAIKDADVNKNRYAIAIECWRNYNQELTQRVNFIAVKRQKNKYIIAALTILSGSIPSSIYLTSYQQKDQKLLMQGKAVSRTVTQEFFNNLHKTAVFKHIFLQEWDYDFSNHFFSFSIEGMM